MLFHGMPFMDAINPFHSGAEYERTHFVSALKRASSGTSDSEKSFKLKEEEKSSVTLKNIVTGEVFSYWERGKWVKNENDKINGLFLDFTRKDYFKDEHYNLPYFVAFKDGESYVNIDLLYTIFRIKGYEWQKSRSIQNIAPLVVDFYNYKDVEMLGYAKREKMPNRIWVLSNSSEAVNRKYYKNIFSMSILDQAVS